jgi:hypothetical protein
MTAFILAMLVGGASAQTNDNVHRQDSEGRTPLMIALADGASLEEIKKLIDRGSDLTATDGEGRTPILNAKLNTKNIPVLEYLISKGADFKAKDLNGRGVVQLSDCSDHKIYEFWSQKGLRLTEESRDGRSAIKECLSKCNAEGISFLISKGVKRPLEWDRLAAQYRCNNKVRSLF